tara:strand:- start:4154 stop:4915 length:762 start_codon:yes stop_codon:yes gene_type:complete
MKISIITVVHNNVATIGDAIDSVAKQTYSNIEHIIIDGGSTDGTVDKIQSNKKSIDKFVSEKDNGIYDAMNKGIAIATGDIIGILNSDDVYFDENVLENVIKTFKTNQSDCVYGDLYYVEKNDLTKIVRYWKSSKFKSGSFATGWHPPHPTFFVKKEIYNKYGLFDLKMKVSADFDLMLRLLEKYQISTAYLSKVLVRMRTGGQSNKSLKNIIISNQSILKSFDKYSIKVNKFTYLFYRLIPKIIQMMKKGNQ